MAGGLSRPGTPEQVAKNEQSYTAVALRAVLDPDFKQKPKRKKNKPAAKKGTDAIRVRGAAQHNLQNVQADILRDKMTVCCGVSGSGKSSLAMDTIYAEGQRRYVESLGAYARQFVGQMSKPAFESIEGLSPAVAIEQKRIGASPRSTVGTVTEVYDYLRILMARFGRALLPRLPGAYRDAIGGRNHR